MLKLYLLEKEDEDWNLLALRAIWGRRHMIKEREYARLRGREGQMQKFQQATVSRLR